MILTKKSQQIDLKELIDSKISEYDIYRYYIGSEIKLNTMMRSPFHKDKHPSFSIGVSSSGRMVWRDYAMDEKGGWTDMVARMFNLTYPQILEKVCKDMYLLDGKDEHQKIISQYTQPVIESRQTLIQVTTKKFTADDMKYWGSYLIGKEELQKENVYSVKDYYINRVKQVLKKDERCYAYYYEGRGMKIYHPDRTRDEGRWKSSIPCSLVENIENLNGDKRVLITKSKKDRVVLSQIVPYVVLSVQNEGSSGYTEEFRKQLEDREVIICYDADDAGVKNCKKICDTWGYRYVNTPKHLMTEHGWKDPSDWVAGTKSHEPLIEHLKEKMVI